jgi:hypothetical protein
MFKLLCRLAIAREGKAILEAAAESIHLSSMAGS